MSITGIRAARAYVELVMNDNKFTRGLALAEAEMRAFANKCTAIGTQAFGMGAAMLTPITYAVGQFKELDDTMRLVRAVTRATAKDFQLLSDKARLLGKTTSFTSQQVADAMANLGRAGFDPRQIDQMIAHVMNLSRATQTGIATTAEIVGNAIRQFGLEAKDAERIVDVMTATANNSSQTLDDIAQSMKYAAPIAKEFGLQIEETAYYIGILANQGLKSEMAGTSLRNMLIRLTGADTQKRFTEDLKVQIRDAEGRVKNIKTLLSEANAAMNAKGWDQLQRGKWLRDVFGLRAIAGGAKFLTVGDQFLNIMNAIADSEGAAARTAKQMDEGIGGAIRITISVFQELANVIGEAVSPEIIQFGKYLQDVMNGWITYLKYHREVVVEWAKLGRALAVGGALFFGIGSVIRTAGTFLGALVGSGKAVAVVWKALSRSADDSGEEMSSAGNAAKKAGSDFGEAAKQFRQAGQDMLKSGKIAVDAGKRMKEATASVTAAGKAVSDVGEQMNVPSEKFKLAAETIAVAGEKIERTNIILAELGRFLRMVAVNATVAARSMEKFVKAVRAINAPMQGVTNRLGKRFEKITKSVGATVTELEKFQRQLAKLETPKDPVGDYIQKTGAAAKQAAPEIDTVATALSGVASAGSGITGTVSQMEQLATAAADAGSAVKELNASVASGHPLQGFQQYATPIGPTNIGGLIKQKADLEQQLASHKDNLQNYYGTQIPLTRDKLTQLQSASVPNVDAIIRTEAELNRLEAEAESLRGQAFSVYGRLAKVNKTLLNEGYTTYRTQGERADGGFHGISIVQQAQNRQRNSEILAVVQEQGKANATPNPSKAEIRNAINSETLKRNQQIRIPDQTKYDSTTVPAELNALYGENIDVAVASGKQVYALAPDYNVTAPANQAGAKKTGDVYKVNEPPKPAQQMTVATREMIGDELVLHPAAPQPVKKAANVSESGMTVAAVQSGGYNVKPATDAATTISDLSSRAYKPGGNAPEEFGIKFNPNKVASGYKMVASEAKSASVDLIAFGNAANKSGVQISHNHNVLKQSSKSISLFGEQSADASAKAMSSATSVKELEGAFSDTVTSARDVSGSMTALKKSVAGTPKALFNIGKEFRYVDKAMNIVQTDVIQTERSNYALAKSAQEVTEKFGDFNLATTKAAISLDNTEEMIKELPPTISTTGKAAQSAAKSFTYVGNAAAIFGQKVVGAIASFAKSLGSIAAFTLAIEGIYWAFKKVKEQMDFRNGKLNLSFEAQGERDDLVQTFPEDEARLRRLVEINAEHNKTNEMLVEAATIIGELQKKYGDLGLRVSQVTKEVEGLKDASEKLSEAELKRKEIANKAAIKELEANNKTIEEYLQVFANENLMSVTEYLPIGGVGPGGAPFGNSDNVVVTKPAEQLDVTELLNTYGEAKDVFAMDDWKEYYEAVYGKPISDAFKDIKKPLVIKNAQGGTNIVSREETSIDPDKIEAYNKQMDQLVENYDQLAKLNAENELIESGKTEIKQKPVLGKPTVDVSATAYGGMPKELTANEFASGVANGEIQKSLTPDNWEPIRKNGARALDELKIEQANLESMPILTGAENLGALNIDELQATLEAIKESGSEEEQNLRRHILDRIEEFRVAINDAVEKGVLKDFDYSQWGDIYQYGKHVDIQKMLDAIQRDINVIYEQTRAEFESAMGPNGEKMYHKKGTPEGELIAEPIMEQQYGELAASRAEGKVKLYENLKNTSDALARGWNLQENLKKQQAINTFLNTMPQNMVQSSADQIEQDIAQRKREAGIGDEFQFKLQDVENWAEDEKKKIESVIADAKKMGQEIMNNLPIDEWAKQQIAGVDEAAGKMKQDLVDEQARVQAEQAQRQEDAKKQLEQRIGSFGGQMGFINGETQDPYSATMDYIKQQRESYATEAEAIATTAKEQGQQVNGKDADEWLTQTQHDIDLWSDISKAQTRAAFGKGYEHKRKADREANYNYNNNTTEWDYENAAIDADIAIARQRQEFARSVGNEQGAAQEEANIQNLNYEKTMNSYYKELENIDILEKNRNQDLKAYKKTTKEIDIAERKLDRNRGKMTDEQIKAEEERIQAMKDEQQVQGARLEVSSAKLGQSAAFINNVESLGNVQQTLFDVSRSFSSKGTFDAYETGGQDVSTWTAEFKEQTTILGNIEDYLATMASGEYL